MTKSKITLAVAVAAMALSVSSAAGGTMLAIPARHDMVYFGFDMLKLLPDTLELACYKGDDAIERLEVFDKASREWITVPSSTWASGSYRADNLVVAGEGKAASELLRLSAWAKESSMPSDRSKLDVVNAINTYQKLTDSQWVQISQQYGFKLKKVEQPSPNIRLRDQARARRAAKKAQKEQEKAAREQIELIRRQNAQRQKPQVEVIPAPVAAETAPVVVAPVAAPKSTSDKALAAPFEGSSAIEDLPPALTDAARIKAAEAPKAPKAEAPKAPKIEAPKAPKAEAPKIVTPKPAADAVKTDIKAAVDNAVNTRLSDENLTINVRPAATPAAPAAAPAAPAAEIRVPAKEVVVAAPEAPAAPETKVPEVKPVEVKIPALAVSEAAPAAPDAEVKAPEVKPAEVTAPAPAAPEAVKTPEIKVPAIVLDPM